jgi:putative membrane protein
VFSALAQVPAAAPGDFGGPGSHLHILAFFFIVIPLFWILVIALFASLGRRRWMRQGWGPGHQWHHAHWAQAGASRGAEATLAERFAQGDIDEKEYRARLEVLRANNSFTPPQAK